MSRTQGFMWTITVPRAWCDERGLKNYTDAAERIQECAYEELEEAFIGEDVGKLDVTVNVVGDGVSPTHEPRYVDRALPPVFKNDGDRRRVERAFTALLNDFATVSNGKLKTT